MSEHFLAKWCIYYIQEATWFLLKTRVNYSVLQAEFECINSKKKQKKKGYKNSGIVSVKVCQVGSFTHFECPNIVQ